jgi:agmatine/peptidylarginine deiminase
MNESLSIDEIIRQAEEIRKKTVKQAQSALEDVNTSANEITKREIEVPKPDIENIKIQPKSENVKTYEKSTASDKTKVGPAIKVEDDGKTKHIDFKPKSKSDDFASQKTVQKSFFTSNVPKNRFIPKSRLKLLKGLPR